MSITELFFHALLLTRVLLQNFGDIFAMTRTL
jgi:hypothetical protein